MLFFCLFRLIELSCGLAFLRRVVVISLKITILLRLFSIRSLDPFHRFILISFFLIFSLSQAIIFPSSQSFNHVALNYAVATSSLHQVQAAMTHRLADTPLPSWMLLQFRFYVPSVFLDCGLFYSSRTLPTDYFSLLQLLWVLYLFPFPTTHIFPSISQVTCWCASFLALKISVLYVFLIIIHLFPKVRPIVSAFKQNSCWVEFSFIFL